jgi:hypothetical protein
MLGIGSAGMARELFLVPAKDFSLVRVGICMVLMMGPAAAWVWWRSRLSESTLSEPGSPSAVSRSPSQP